METLFEYPKYQISCGFKTNWKKEESAFVMSFYSWKDPNTFVYCVWYSVYDNYLGLSQNYDKKLNCRGIKWQIC